MQGTLQHAFLTCMIIYCAGHYLPSLSFRLEITHLKAPSLPLQGPLVRSVAKRPRVAWERIEPNANSGSLALTTVRRARVYLLRRVLETACLVRKNAAGIRAFVHALNLVEYDDHVHGGQGSRNYCPLTPLRQRILPRDSLVPHHRGGTAAMASAARFLSTTSPGENGRSPLAAPLSPPLSPLRARSPVRVKYMLLVHKRWHLSEHSAEG